MEKYVKYILLVFLLSFGTRVAFSNDPILLTITFMSIAVFTSVYKFLDVNDSNKKIEDKFKQLDKEISNLKEELSDTKSNMSGLALSKGMRKIG